MLFPLKPRKNKRTMLFLFFLAAMPLWGQPADSQLYKDIDEAILAENAGKITEILASCKNTSSYNAVESYVMKSARNLIAADKFELAQQLTLSVLDNNLDNYEAAGLYTSIERAIAKRQAQQKAEEEKQQLAELRQAAALFKAKAEIQKEYKTITNLSSGETIYLDQTADTYFNPIAWTIFMGPVIGLVSENGDDFTSSSVKGGFSFGGNIFYRENLYSVGVDIAADSFLQSFTDSQNFITSCKIAAMASFKKISPHIFLRFGYAGFFTRVEKSVGRTVLPEPVFNGMLIGVGLHNIQMGKIGFDAFFDYNFGAQFYEKLTAAADIKLNASFILADFDKLDVRLNCGVLDSFALAADSGFQNQIKFIVTIGVGNND